MEEFCLKLLNMSIQASFLIVIVIVLRLILRKSPKWIHCLMWLLVAVRLVCPFSIESTYSLAPNAEVISTSENEKRPNIQSGVVLIDRSANAYLETYYSKKNTVEQYEEELNPVSVLSVIWLLGLGALTLYAVVGCFKIWKLVRESVEVQKHIFICDRINIPFIFGIMNPHIYLPSNLNEEQKKNVLAHEQAHLKRGDHFWKPFGYALLAVYWFNPLCWVSYILLCTDIEMACDEEVIKAMDTEQKKIYSKTLLSLSDSGSFISACPLAFGEVGVKQRIKSVLNYRKPAFWIVVIAIAVIIITSVLFLTNPKASDGDNNGLAGNTELELNGESAAPENVSDSEAFAAQVPWILETVEDIFGEPGYLHNYQGRGYWEECHCFYNQQLEPILFVCGEYYFVDFDNDGINELINNQHFAADGAQSTLILKKLNGKIQCGYADDLLDVEYDNYGFSSEYSYYLPEENKVEIFYWMDSKQKYESKKYAIDLNKIELYEYYSEFLYRDFVSELTKDENMEVDYIKDPYTGHFIVEGNMVYKYKKYLTGKNINEEHGVLYIVLTNDRDITWEQVNRSLISSNSADGLSETLIIGIKAID